MRGLFFARLGFAVAVAGALAPAARAAALVWEKPRLEITAKFADKEAVGLFHFVNSGKSPVTILSVKPSCGCTTAELAKQTYAPGESGDIKVVFTFQGRTGLNEKTVEVVTDDAPDHPKQLVMMVTIVEPMTCSPRLLLWRIGSENGQKASVISANGANRITAVEIKSFTPNDTQITHRLETVEAGKKYRLVVQPVSVAKDTQTTIACVVSFADGTAQPVSVFALVK